MFFQASKGLLGGMLERERAEMTRKSNEMSRHNRFGGQFRVAIASSKGLFFSMITIAPISILILLRRSIVLIFVFILIKSISFTFNNSFLRCYLTPCTRYQPNSPCHSPCHHHCLRKNDHKAIRNWNQFQRSDSTGEVEEK